MKNCATLIILFAITITFGCFAQSFDSIPPNSKMDTTSLLAYKKTATLSVPIIVYYHVEERINMKFGSSITTYNVSNLSLVHTNDLGPNNTRVITPKFGNAKVQPVEALDKEQLKFLIDIIATPEKPNRVYEYARDDKERFIIINILNTYENVLNRGFKSVEMLKRVGDRRYFEGELVMAAKWYTQLFDITTDLEVEYYYRYAMSLIAIFEVEKANEMMKLFEEKKERK
jgi:hypothetical protein